MTGEGCRVSGAEVVGIMWCVRGMLEDVGGMGC